MSDWDFDGEIGPGAAPSRSRLVQEWLSLHGHGVVIDGKFGPATRAAVREFQARKNLGQTGRVNRQTFDELLAPLRNACQMRSAQGSLGDTIIRYARQHLAERPREVGGQNMGPWVRLYMKGNQGADWPWCAGFVSFLLKQAADTQGMPMPIRPSFSCDLLAADAQTRGVFLPESRVQSSNQLPAGSVFLQRRSPRDWSHTGIVVAGSGQAFESIEGNTNDAGDREGYEVCRRTRGLKNKDYIVFS